MLGIAVEKVCNVIVRVRAFDARVEVVEPDPGRNPVGDAMVAVLEDYNRDPVYAELMDFIGALNEDEQVNLVALTWLGRGDYTAAEWDAAVKAAREARSDHTDTYLLGIPLLGDYLDEGLAQLGYSSEC
jgi:hypothetical protein